MRIIEHNSASPHPAQSALNDVDFYLVALPAGQGIRITSVLAVPIARRPTLAATGAGAAVVALAVMRQMPGRYWMRWAANL